MRGGRWKRPSPTGPARRGLEARPRSVSPTPACLGRSGVCGERPSWSRGRAGHSHPPPGQLHAVTFTLSLAGAMCGTGTAPMGHFLTSCP